MQCLLCHEEGVFAVPEGTTAHGFRCRVCGDYHIGDQTYAIVNEREKDTVHADLASWVYLSNRVQFRPRFRVQ